MNETTDQSKPKRRFPLKTFVFTLLLVVPVVVLHFMAEGMIQNNTMDPAIPFLALVLVIPLLVFVWGIRAIMSKTYRKLGILVIVLEIGFFVLYYPDVRGDIEVNGFIPRFWARSAEYVEPVTESNPADVATTSEIDFPQFLGPDRNGQVHSVELSDWGTPPEELWKIDVGEGWSGFVVVNGFAITQEQRGAEECVTCYKAETGELVWIFRATRRHEDTMAMGKVGPRATPTIDDGLVYTTSGTGILDCINGANGELIWSANIPELVGIEQNELTNSMGLDYTMEKSALAWGRSCSPLIVDDMVIVPAGGPTAEEGQTSEFVTLIAFDKKTGNEIWRGGNRMISYGSPSLATIDGQRQILLVSQRNAVGHDPATGKELWHHPWPGTSSADANCSQVTVVDGTRLILSKGYQQGGELIEVKNSEKGWTVKSLNRDPRLMKTKLTSPVVHAGHAYSLSSKFLECCEIETFSRKWIQRGGFGNGQLLVVGDKLLVHCEKGELKLIQADPSGFSELGSVKTVKGISWNTICLYGDLVLVRSEREAACYRLPTVSP